MSAGGRGLKWGGCAVAGVVEGCTAQAKCRACAGGGGLKENEGEGPFYVACGQLKGPLAAEEPQGAKIRY